jgi:uncharacterized protein YndB with AHSA1/START domain
LAKSSTDLTTAAHPDETLVLTREFDAPRDLVFKVYTEAEHLAQWWGPKGFTMETCTIDLRPGGMFHYGMRSPQGQVMWGRWVFREVVPPQRLTFVVSFSDEQGGIGRHPGSPTWPQEMLSTMTLEERDGKTLITVRTVPINATEEELRTFKAGHDSVRMGFNGTLDQLDQYLAKIR